MNVKGWLGNVLPANAKWNISLGFNGAVIVWTVLAIALVFSVLKPGYSPRNTSPTLRDAISSPYWTSRQLQQSVIANQVAIFKTCIDVAYNDRIPDGDPIKMQGHNALKKLDIDAVASVLAEAQGATQDSKE